MKRHGTSFAFFGGVAHAAHALGLRLRSLTAAQPVPCWTDYLRETAPRDL